MTTSEGEEESQLFTYILNNIEKILHVVYYLYSEAIVLNLFGK